MALEILIPAPSRLFSDADRALLREAFQHLPANVVDAWSKRLNASGAQDVINRLTARVADLEYPSRRRRAREFLRAIGATDDDEYDLVVETRNRLQHPGVGQYPEEGHVWSQYQALYKWARRALAVRLGIPPPSP